MGAVYVARHELMGRDAVVKVLLPNLSQNKEMVTRFFNSVGCRRNRTPPPRLGGGGANSGAAQVGAAPGPGSDPATAAATPSPAAAAIASARATRSSGHLRGRGDAHRLLREEPTGHHVHLPGDDPLARLRRDPPLHPQSSSVSDLNAAPSWMRMMVASATAAASCANRCPPSSCSRSLPEIHNAAPAVTSVS